MLGVLSLVCFGLGFLTQNTIIGVPLLLSSPATASLALILAVVELVRAKRGRASWRESYWAQLGLITSLFCIACWVGLLLWIYAVVRGIGNHPY